MGADAMEEHFFFFWDGPFGQWYESDFVIDGVKYNTAEQYMMASKARLFEDQTMLAAIMAAPFPGMQKALGRKVAGFDQARWNDEARAIVYRGNYAKFTQSRYLLNLLLRTAGLTLVEASPYDRIWGIGLLESDPRALNRDTWRGLNWLGETLSRVRDDLVAERGGAAGLIAAD